MAMSLGRRLEQNNPGHDRILGERRSKDNSGVQ
jgi:hypothetical protein